MNWKEQYKSFLWILGFFVFAYFMPIETEKFKNAIIDAFSLAKWYAQEHVLLCLVPAFFIAGVIIEFIHNCFQRPADGRDRGPQFMGGDKNKFVLKIRYFFKIFSFFFMQFLYFFRRSFEYPV